MKSFLLFAALILIAIANTYAQDEARLMRFPAIHGDQIVFSYAGDLYKVDRNGGTARKLTNYVGYEMFARFSPDGKTIAFTAEYDGNREVYTMPAEGGVPSRMTYTATLGRDDISDRMGPNNIVMTWMDNENIVFRSRKKTFNAFQGQLFSVSVKGGMEKEIEVPRGGWCSFNEGATKMAYNRIFREFRTWKYYKGGMADDVWIYDFKTQNLENITNNDAQDIFPMWKGNKIFYLSDRDRTMNLFEYDITTKQTRKITKFDVYDIKFPSIGDKDIIFENAGYLYVYNIETEKLEKIKVQINDDFIYSRNELIDASKFITSIDLAPDAKRVLFSARGEVMTVPAEHGITRNLTKSSGANDRDAVWSPDGKAIACISDADGEDEIYIYRMKDGAYESQKITTGSTTYKYDLKWSPDSKKILWSDKELNLKYIDIETKKITTVVKAESWEIRDYNWAPDSKWIVYTKPEVETMSKIYIYNLDSKKEVAVTEGWFNSRNAVFSSDGKYLFFVSDRDFNPIYSNTEWNHAYVDMARVYFITLSKNTSSPFEAKNDEVGAVVKTEKTEANSEIIVQIDFDGIQSRIISLPGEASNYGNLTIIGNQVYYIKRSRGEKAEFKLYDLDKQKETNLGEYHSYVISYDHKKMLIAKNRNYYIIDLPKSEIKLNEGQVDLSGMKINVNKKEEWNQIFNEAWRQMRDFFYDPGMHGQDWIKIKEKYQPLVAYVNHRDDLNYILGEMIGELNVGHSYVGGGDRPTVEKINMGLLGAEFEKDKTGYFKITKILEGQNWDKSLRSPLTEVGLNVKVGDIITAVNGESTKDVNNIYSLLIGQAGKEVLLSINSKSSGERDVVVVPISDESGLYYYNWVQNNIKIVDEATDGKVGYIHIPDMGVAGLNEFSKYFYPQLGKKALIIDDRGNGGGNVSPMIIERLRREMSRANMARNTVKSATPRQMIHGPLVCLINEYSASDGDLFPYQFRRHKLGKLIGKRTWGGVVGIRGPIPFVDGGTLYKPEFSTYDENGWIIEGEGVSPDIYVDNNPGKEYSGTDEQLLKAIEVILKDLEKNSQEIPDIPEFPDKTK